MAAVVASHDRVTVADLISPQLRQFLLTHYERVRREIETRIQTMKTEDKAGG